MTEAKIIQQDECGRGIYVVPPNEELDRRLEKLKAEIGECDEYFVEVAHVDYIKKNRHIFED